MALNQYEVNLELQELAGQWRELPKEPVVRIEKVFRLPVAALRLNEDIRALERIIEELGTLDIGNITQNSADGVNILRMMQSMTRLCHKYAVDKLKREHLR